MHIKTLLDYLKSSKNYCPRKLFSGSNSSPEKSLQKNRSIFCLKNRSCDRSKTNDVAPWKNAQRIRWTRTDWMFGVPSCTFETSIWPWCVIQTDFQRTAISKLLRDEDRFCSKRTCEFSGIQFLRNKMNAHLCEKCFHRRNWKPNDQVCTSRITRQILSSCFPFGPGPTHRDLSKIKTLSGKHVGSN